MAAARVLTDPGGFVLRPCAASRPWAVSSGPARALFGSWYEFFPRSEGAYVDRNTGKVVSGNFRTAAKRLDAVAAMGFDVLYLPPIHPIGDAFRKGPNNTLDSGPDDPGVPWAIGNEEGGHLAIAQKAIVPDRRRSYA